MTTNQQIFKTVGKLILKLMEHMEMNWTGWIPDQILPKATKYCQVMHGYYSYAMNFCAPRTSGSMRSMVTPPGRLVSGKAYDKPWLHQERNCHVWSISNV